MTSAIIYIADGGRSTGKVLLERKFGGRARIRFSMLSSISVMRTRNAFRPGVPHISKKCLWIA